MFCKNCGAQLDDGLKFCTNCGKPVSVNAVAPPPVPPDIPVQTSAYRQAAPFQQQININIPQQPVVPKTKWEVPRLVIGIITVCLFFLFQVQSCTASVGESLKSIFSENTGTSGATGYVVSFFFLIAGIISVACRKSKGGAITAGVVYALCGMVLANEDSSYFRDLAVYCFFSFAFAVVMIIGGILQQANLTDGRRPPGSHE